MSHHGGVGGGELQGGMEIYQELMEFPGVNGRFNQVESVPFEGSGMLGTEKGNDFLAA